MGNIDWLPIDTLRLVQERRSILLWVEERPVLVDYVPSQFPNGHEMFLAEIKRVQGCRPMHWAEVSGPV